MSNKPKRQASFTRLAAGQASTRRTDIMLAATDTFCSCERPDKVQVDQYKELFYSLIAETAETGKRLIASALAKNFYTPRAILMYLALEDAPIASPILAYAKGLGQFDLLQIIDKTSPSHHKVIANRNDLGSTVIDTLVELDKNLVIKRKRDIPVADVTERSANNSSLEELLTPDSDIEQQQDSRKTVLAAIDEMDSILFTRADNKLDNRSSLPEGAVDVLLQTSPVDNPRSENKVKLAMDELITLANRGQRLGSIEDLLVDKPDIENKSFGQQLLDATIGKSRQDQVQLIRDKFDLNAGSAHAVYGDYSGDTLAVTLKAAKVNGEIALQIISLSIPNVGLSSHNISRMSKIYPALNQPACLETVKTWSRTNDTTRRSHAPSSADTNFRDTRSISNQSQPEKPLPNSKEHKAFGAQRK